MSHLNTAYQLGAATAQETFEKQAFGGLLKSIGQAAGQTWKAMSPASQGIAKRLGAGGLVGGGAGAIAGGEGNRGTGALIGALGGGLGMAGAGRLMQNRAALQLSKDLGYGARKTRIGRRLRDAKPQEMMTRLESLKPVYQQGERHLQSRLLPGVAW